MLASPPIFNLSLRIVLLFIPKFCEVVIPAFAPPPHDPLPRLALVVFILFPPKFMEFCILPFIIFNEPFPSYRKSLFTSTPAPALMFPNVPLRRFALVVRLMIRSVSLSSKPVSCAISDFCSTTCIFSIISAGRFFVACSISPSKNFFPSTLIFLMSCP